MFKLLFVVIGNKVFNFLMSSLDRRMLRILKSFARVVWKELLGTLAKVMSRSYLNSVKFTIITHCINIMFLRHEFRDVNIIRWWHHFRNTRVVIVFGCNRGKLSDAGVGIFRDRLHSRNLKLLERYGSHCWCLLETNCMFMIGVVNRRHIHIWLREIGRHLSHAQLVEFARLLII